MFKAYRIYDFIKDDSLDMKAAFVDRLYPRGIRKEIFSNFIWLKDITPSPSLREWFHEDREGRFDEFCDKFEHELDNEKAKSCFKMLKKLEKEYGDIALLTASKDIDLCHIPVLLKVLNK
ncbi:DUF488 domain-containing protein [Campylobacter concisus]|uniref:DUF488 domain-containing protein n=1 Tax=Campylobacter concisus TaxID=199 RepID=UPI000CD9B419|nr:DUF488 family protein [Campylobacter concisus]